VLKNAFRIPDPCFRRNNKTGTFSPLLFSPCYHILLWYIFVLLNTLSLFSVADSVAKYFFGNRFCGFYTFLDNLYKNGTKMMLLREIYCKKIFGIKRRNY